MKKVMEGRSYLGELRGKKKRKESVFGLAKTVRKLNSSFGQVALNFGDAIPLAEVLDHTQSDWRELPYGTDYRPPWLNQAVSALSARVAQNINAAVAVNPIGMTATVLLGNERPAMGETQLIRLMDQCADLLRACPLRRHGNPAQWQRQRLAGVLRSHGAGGPSTAKAGGHYCSARQ